MTYDGAVDGDRVGGGAAGDGSVARWPVAACRVGDAPPGGAARRATVPAGARAKLKARIHAVAVGLVWIAFAGTLAAGLPVFAAPAADAPAAAAPALTTLATVAAATAAPAAAPATAAEATLVVFNREIVTFRSVLLGVPPADRARRARAVIDELLERSHAPRVTVHAIPEGSLVRIDGAMVFLVTPDDADRLRNQTAAEAAAAAAAALERAIADTEESRNVRAMARAAGVAAAVTMGFGLLLWLLGRVRRHVDAWVVARASLHARRVRIAGAEGLIGERVVAGLPRVMGFGYAAGALLIAYEWLSIVLAQFPYTRVWGERLNGFLLGVLGDVMRGVLRAIPDLFTALVIVVLARVVARLLNAFFARVRSGHIRLSWLDADLAEPTRRIAVAVLWLFAFAMAYPYLPGAQTEAFKGVSVLVGLMISLGASNLVGQGASGLILTYAKVFRRGEFVRIAEHEGTVTEVGMFATRVRTGLGEELTLPNSLVLGNVTKNYSRAVKGPGYVVDTTVTIGYDTPWRQVHAMLVEAARRTEGVLDDPAPRVFQTELSDFYPAYRLVCQAIPSEPRPRAEVLNALHANIQDVFNENGVQIMSPHYLVDPAEVKVVPPARWDPPLA